MSEYKIWFTMAQSAIVVTGEEYSEALNALRASKGCFSIKTWDALQTKSTVKTYPWTEIYLLIKEDI